MKQQFANHERDQQVCVDKRNKGRKDGTLATCAFMMLRAEYAWSLMRFSEKSSRTTWLTNVALVGSVDDRLAQGVPKKTLVTRQRGGLAGAYTPPVREEARLTNPACFFSVPSE